MITALVLLIVLDVDSLAALFFLVVIADVLILLVVVIRLQPALLPQVLLLSGAALGPEASARLPHLIKQVVTAR